MRAWREHALGRAHVRRTGTRAVHHWTHQREGRALRAVQTFAASRRVLFAQMHRAVKAMRARGMRRALNSWCRVSSQWASAVERLTRATLRWKAAALAQPFHTWQLLFFFWQLASADPNDTDDQPTGGVDVTDFVDAADAADAGPSPLSSNVAFFAVLSALLFLFSFFFFFFPATPSLLEQQTTLLAAASINASRFTWFRIASSGSANGHTCVQN